MDDPTQLLRVRQETNADARRVAFDQQGAGAVLQGKPQAVEAMLGGLGADFVAATTGPTADPDRAMEIAAEISAVRSQMGSAAPAAKRHIQDMFAAAGLHLDATEPELDRNGNPTGRQQPMSIEKQLVDQLAATTHPAAPGGAGQAARAAIFAEIRNVAGSFEGQTDPRV
jgi:hypothetical protein